MFERISAYAVDPDDIARGLNSDYGVDEHDWQDPRRVEGYDILNALSSEQSYGCNCYVSIYIGKSELDDAVEMYNRAIDEMWEEVDYYAVRMRALNWLRTHIPLTEDRVLLAVDY